MSRPDWEMSVCDDGHEAIAHNRKTCPLCEAEKRIIELEHELEEKEES